MEYSLNTVRVLELVQQRGYRSLNDFAVRNGIHRNSLLAYGSGRQSALTDVVLRLAEALEVDPLTLLNLREFAGSAASEYVQLLKMVREMAEHWPGTAYFLFGSRNERRAREYSDWDLGVTGGAEKVETERLLKMRIRLDDHCENFSRKVDLVNFDEAPVWFLRGIGSKPRFMAGSLAAFQYLLGVLDGIKREDRD